MNSLLEQLRDIDGLDPISLWPLAIGWIILIVFGICLACLIAWRIVREIKFRRSWKNDSLKKLSLLEKNLSDKTARECVIALSEYIKRICLKRFSRNACAGLSGQAFLKWLKENDPKQFDWETKGNLLIDIPYAPLVNHKIAASEVKDLIQAAKGLIH